MDQKPGQEGKHRGLQVIGVGLPRTGTTSLQTALELLGYGPCHTFRTGIVEQPYPYTDCQQWVKAYGSDDKAERQKILRRIYERGGWNCAVDYPTASFIEDLAEMYPDAKLVHSVRSSGITWRKSINETIGALAKRRWLCCWLPSLRWSLFPVTDAFLAHDRSLYGVGIYDEPLGEARVYDRFNERVKAVAPRERTLFDFEPSMGWEPLCNFLGKPIPQDEDGKPLPYPNVHDLATMKRIRRILEVVGLVSWVIVLGGCASIVNWGILPLIREWNA